MSKSIHDGQMWVVSLESYGNDYAWRPVAVCDSYESACDIYGGYVAQGAAGEELADSSDHGFPRIDPVPMFRISKEEQ